MLGSLGVVVPAATGRSLADTGTTAFTTATISAALLILGGLAVALGRRRRRHG
ncbi:LPXTG cell wall anchor domain-containing protein [Kitasatospora sp. NPDC059463]|uniref:LPXTG cell wall anchor domain-containing protein n=1 Tax=unclassified Kitasatospora TaxID=2633591 RepID=UPI003681F115